MLREFLSLLAYLMDWQRAQGAFAWCNGLPLDANPFDPDKAPWRYSDWADGWRSASGRHALLVAAIGYGRVS